MRIKGPMKWCDLRSDFTNEFTVVLADSWRKVCAGFAGNEQVAFAAANPRFDSKQEYFFGLRLMLFVSNVYHSAEKFMIAKHSALNEALYRLHLAHKSIRLSYIREILILLNLLFYVIPLFIHLFLLFFFLYFLEDFFNDFLSKC